MPNRSPSESKSNHAKSSPISANLSGAPTVRTQWQEALDAERADLLAMREEHILRDARLDFAAAASVAEASMELLAPFRAPLAEQFGPVANATLDATIRAARAVKQANIEVQRVQSGTDLTELGKEVARHHLLLITDAQSLVNRGLIPEAELAPARDTHGYQATVLSVGVLVSTLQAYWPTIEGQTPLKKDDISRAMQAAERLSATLQNRDHGVARSPALELRTRALSKLLRTYDEVRRMMTFLRWHQDDADTFVPSLWAATRGRRRTEISPSEPTVDVPVINDQPIDPNDSPFVSEPKT